MIPAAVGVLVAKELRQALRGRGALLSTFVLPMLLLLVMPLVQLFAARGARAAVMPGAAASLPGGLGLHDPFDAFYYFSLPLLVTLGGILTPSLAAIHAVTSERDRRSLDLLVALPVSLREILTAKLAATLLLAGAITLPLYGVDAFWLAKAGAPPAVVGGGLLLLLGALGCSVGVSLTIALLARDVRTANNLSGAFVLPVMVLAATAEALVPGAARFPVLAGLLLLLGGLALVVAARWITLERYLS